MHKQILLPTGGSRLSLKAATQAIAPAKAMRARLLTAFHASPAYPLPVSHGRRGVSALVLGSETKKVHAHSKLPLRVVR